MLTDAGALLALISPRDKWHTACESVLQGLRVPMVTPHFVFGEAMYLVGERYGQHRQALLWAMLESGALKLYANTEPELMRMRILTEKYRDIERGGMDLGDAALVAAAETLALREVFTIDSHFYAYQLADGTYLAVKPGVV